MTRAGLCNGPNVSLLAAKTAGLHTAQHQGVPWHGPQCQQRHPQVYSSTALQDRHPKIVHGDSYSKGRQIQGSESPG